MFVVAGVGCGVETGRDGAGDTPIFPGPDGREARNAIVTISLLGPMRLSRDGVEIALPASRKVRSLLAYLLLAPRPLHRSRLCEIFWDSPNDPRGELRWCLSKIRSVLDDPDRKYVRADRNFVSIETAVLQVDAITLQDTADAVLSGSDMSNLDRLIQTIAGDFLDGLTTDHMPLFDAWLAAQREHFRTLHIRILSRIIELLPTGSNRQLVKLRKRIELQPDDAASHRTLLTALATAGRIAEGDAHLALAMRLLKRSGVSSGVLEKTWRATKQQALQNQPGPQPDLPTDDGPSGENGPALDRDPGASLILATLRTRSVPQHNLPPHLTSYIGRGDEASEVKARLASHRLVTLVGAGGCGKTRLAVEVGRGLQESSDGIWLIELATIGDPQLVGEVLCSSIGIAVGDNRPAVDRAASYLRDRKALIILDNAEHLIDTVAALTVSLLRSCPRLLILATSRERLNVPGESVYQVPGLSVPPFMGPVKAAEARRHDAVRLFEERAKAVVQAFVLLDDNAEAIGDICRQLDGLPLGIELVVPQLRMMQPDGLAARLQDSVLLVKGGRGAHPRHRTLGAMFDWSYNLLSPEECTLFCRLAVFNGGWSLAAAMAVAGEDEPQDELFDVLARLVDKSLVVADLRNRVPRYTYLQTTRQYALAKLAESGASEFRRRLATYMIQRFVDADASWPTTPTGLWLAAVEPDLDNLRASLDWAFGPDGDARLGVTLCAHSRRVWDELALLSERERWFALAFARHDDQTPPHVLARLWLGRLSNSSHGDRNNYDLAKQAADLFRVARDDQGLGEALAKAGAALERPDTTAEALPYLEDARRLMSTAGPSKPLAGCLRSLAVARYFDRDFASARSFLVQSEATASAVGDARGIAAVQIAAAELAFAAGSHDEAIVRINELLSGRNGNRRQMVLGLTNLTAYLLACDRVSEARLVALKALQEARALDWHAGIVRLVEHAALIAALTDDIDRAARMLGHTVAFYATGAASREYTELATFDRLSLRIELALPVATRALLMAEGAGWSVDQAAEHAITIVGGGTRRSAADGIDQHD